MSFVHECFYKIYLQLIDKIKQEKETLYFWKSDIHVTKKWLFSIEFSKNRDFEELIIRQKTRPHGYVKFQNGEMIECKSHSQFRYLLMSWNDHLLDGLQHRKTFKISKIAFNERFSPSSLYHWNKLEYFLNKKYIQSSLYDIFHDVKYQRRQLRIDQGISSYSNHIKTPLLK